MKLTSRKMCALNLGAFVCLGLLAACGAPKTTQETSETKTVVGRGGAFWDNRVQFINAIPNPKDDTTCLYVTEYDRKTAPNFDTKDPLTSEQLAFLERAERESVALTQYPVSIADLDAGLAKKENQRRIRGGINNAVGALATFFGISSAVLVFAALSGPVVMGAAGYYGGMTALQALGWMFGFNGIGAYTYSYLAGAAGGIGLLSQASRDFSPKNYDVRAENAASGLNATNLNVTLAFSEVAKSLPAASKIACPKNVASESVNPFLSEVKKQMGEFTHQDYVAMESKAQKRSIFAEGCAFTADIKGERLNYQATPRLTVGPRRSLDVTIYVLEKSGSMRLLGETVLQEQLRSDAGAGVKFAGDSELGSMAIWIDPTQVTEILPAKIAHRLPSGEFLGNVGHIEGTCKL